MNVLVDACIWSLALRRESRPSDILVVELRELIYEFRVRIIGPVRQEVLSGIREPSHFNRLQEDLRAFPDVELSVEDHELAAEFFNVCRRRGIQGSNTDFLICAVAQRRGFSVFTSDKDFRLFRSCLSVRLHRPRPSLLGR